MKKIASFTINHLALEPGIYVSRRDAVGGDVVTTFDIRMKRPNREPVLVDWGPMGCLTGNYLLVRGECDSHDVLPLMIETFRFVASFEGEIPGATPRDCGTALLHDLPMARYEAAKYVQLLEQATERNLNYPE